MPVSKKRKKDGKPVHRKELPASPQEAHPHGPETAPAPVPVGSRSAIGKPSNPFVSAQSRRASQRGR